MWFLISYMCSVFWATAIAFYIMSAWNNHPVGIHMYFSAKK